MDANLILLMAYCDVGNPRQVIRLDTDSLPGRSNLENCRRAVHQEHTTGTMFATAYAWFLWHGFTRGQDRADQDCGIASPGVDRAWE